MSEREFSQIDEQLAVNQPASILVERGDGSITPGQIMGVGEHGARVFFGNLNMETDRAIPTKIVTAEHLSDAHQQVLAEKLAGVALLGTKTEVVAETFDVEAANLERGHRDALEEKRRAQREGRGEDSIYWGQVAGKYAQDAQKIRSRRA